jgi:hypothetical protein
MVKTVTAAGIEYHKLRPRPSVDSVKLRKYFLTPLDFTAVKRDAWKNAKDWTR